MFYYKLNHMTQAATSYFELEDDGRDWATHISALIQEQPWDITLQRLVLTVDFVEKTETICSQVGYAVLRNGMDLIEAKHTCNNTLNFALNQSQRYAIEKKNFLFLAATRGLIEKRLYKTSGHDTMFTTLNDMLQESEAAYDQLDRFKHVLN